MPLERPEPALRLAIDLVHVPSRAAALRRERLPNDIDVLLRIASGDTAVIKEAARATGREEPVIRDAATFFVEQVLLAPDSDSYRVLGVTPFATAEEMRRNMALLMHWLHPDLSADPHRSVLAQRVSGAWETLKTVERRAVYDQARLAELKVADKRRRDGRKSASGRAATPGNLVRKSIDGRRQAQRFLIDLDRYREGPVTRAKLWLRSFLRLH